MIGVKIATMGFTHFDLDDAIGIDGVSQGIEAIVETPTVKCRPGRGGGGDEIRKMEWDGVGDQVLAERGRGEVGDGSGDCEHEGSGEGL